MMLYKVAARRTAYHHSSKLFLRWFSALFLVGWLVSPASAGPDDLVRTPVNPADRVPLAVHLPSWANAQNDQGAVPPDLKLEQLTIVLARSPQKQQAYTKFLADQQNPQSPDYHHWLTPVELGKRFGASLHDIHAVSGWLESQNLHVDAVSNSRDRITFSGAASQVGSAFGAEMHYFTVGNEKRISIAAEPQIPVALKSVIKAISGLFTIRYYPQHNSRLIHVPARGPGKSGVYTPDATFSSGNVIFPADFAKIYNVTTPSIDGTGQTIAIVGRSRVYDPDIQNFETQAALTVKTTPETVIIPPLGTDPGEPEPTKGDGKPASGDQSEATLDVTRSGSIAQGATIDLVVSASSATEDGIQIAANYVVDTTPVPANIMSISFGSCEAQTGGQAAVTYWDDLFQQAAGEGISVFVSSGDSAAAGCDTSFTTPPTTQVLSPNSICSSSHVTCVGGTEFADSANPSQYWSSTNGTGFESALGYIPEGAWNEPKNSSGAIQVAGTGGGVSAYIATPTYQMGVTGVPGTQGRYTPDIAFSASAHDGYFGCLAANGGSCVESGGGFSFELFSGTSAAAPDMAGITALLNQNTGSAQGPLNTTLYQLAATTTNGVFNDVTVASSGVTGCVVTTPSMCNNSTASPTALTGGLAGYLVDTGYDEATGLGSINVANLLTNWPSSTKTATTTTLAGAPTGAIPVGTTVTLTATISPAPPDGETVTFKNGSTALGTATTSSGTATFTSSTLPGGTYNVIASYPGDSTLSASTSSVATFNIEDFTLSPSTGVSITISAPGGSGSGTISYTLLGGLSGAPAFTCTGAPSEATCTLAAGSAADTETVTVSTTAASWLHGDPLGRGNRVYYALLFPGLLGLVLSLGRRKRTLRVLLGLIAMLAILTLWMPACSGGGSSTQQNPGTPVGQYTLTVTATDSGISHNITVSVNLQ